MSRRIWTWRARISQRSTWVVRRLRRNWRAGARTIRKQNPAWWSPSTRRGDQPGGGINLEGAELRFANLERADLRGAYLPRVDFPDAESIKGVRICRAHLDHTQLTRKQPGGAIGQEVVAMRETRAQVWLAAKETYLALKNDFEQSGPYDDASWAYRKERRMEKREA